MTSARGTVSEAALGELRREIVRRATPVLDSAGIGAATATCRLVPDGRQLTVHFDLPVAVSPAVEQALAVRVLDAVRGAGRTYGPVAVSVDTPA
jgi:hypothetical protein